MVEISDEEYALFLKLAKVWYHSEPDKTGAFFISGEGGERDERGLPEIILICPAMGLDYSVVYRKEKGA